MKKAEMFGICYAGEQLRRHFELVSGSNKVNAKHGAMFGLCRALKKQSGGLFLVSRHSVDSEETRGSFKATRGAMFGLDARIALAIFGALSVISGAALYSAIQQAKVTAIITEANELGKAITQYYLDTGSLPKHSTYNGPRDISGLALKVAPSGITNWKGPYYPYVDSSREWFKSSQGYNMLIPYRTEAAWANISPSGTCKKTSPGCYLYIWFTGLDNALKLDLEEKLDGNSTTATENVEGNFRYDSNGGMIKLDIYYDPQLAAS